ncbi:hypothetical protein [Castellaniella sp.]|uniref:hypothetical protein n=1 Tax=Castellaniella sp. TaxID=1955812 RepID=UPI002AFF834C|nr:hypothetical protein [Castellaniella sp.]
MMPLEALSSVLPAATDHSPAERKTVAGVTHLAPPLSPLSAQSSISNLGRTLSKTGAVQSRYQDIEDSDLPDGAKSLLRMIRDLREMLNRLARELQQVQADKQMPAETKRVRLLQLQAQISAVNSALVQATQKLASLIRNASLDQAQQMTAGQLAL